MGAKRPGFSLDMTKWPPIEYADLFNYFINTPGIYTKEALKAYKSLDGYDYFISGHVHEVFHSDVSPDSPVCLLKARVLPSQRLNDEPHDPWICGRIHNSCPLYLQSWVSYFYSDIISAVIFDAPFICNHNPHLWGNVCVWGGGGVVAGLMCQVVTFSASPQCGGSAGLLRFGSIPRCQWYFLLCRVWL